MEIEWFLNIFDIGLDVYGVIVVKFITPSSLASYDGINIYWGRNFYFFLKKKAHKKGIGI